MTDGKTAVQQRKKPRHWALEGTLSLVSALLFVLAIRSTFIEPFKIPSGSMIPTLYVGDQIFVNKASYGLRVPFTDWIGEKPRYFFHFDPPKRGDIIVFKYPVDPDFYYIKRIVGTPGDTVEVRNKEVFINGQALERKPVEQDKVDAIFTDLENNPRYPKDQMTVMYEKFREDKTGIIMEDKRAYSFAANQAPTKIPENKYFVMGDNRDDSQDSRFWGFVDFDQIKGRAVVIWLSIWLDFDQSTMTFRPERIGTILK